MIIDTLNNGCGQNDLYTKDNKLCEDRRGMGREQKAYINANINYCKSNNENIKV